MAAASVVLGIIGLIIPIICSLLAVVLGLVGLARTRNPRIGGRRSAFAGVVLGLAGLALGTYSITQLVTIVEKVRATNRAESCEARLRAIGVAMLRYAAANDGRFPDELNRLPVELLGGPEALTCPSAARDVEPVARLPDGRAVSYHYVGQRFTTAAAAETVLMYEALEHHGPAGMNVLFVDGRVQPIGPIEAGKAIVRLKIGQNPPWTQTRD